MTDLHQRVAEIMGWEPKTPVEELAWLLAIEDRLLRAGWDLDFVIDFVDGQYAWEIERDDEIVGVSHTDRATAAMMALIEGERR